MLRLVLDTNVVLDLLHFRDAAAAPLLQVLQSGKAVAFRSAACFDELTRVLNYPEFGIAGEDVQRILEVYARLTLHCEAVADQSLPKCRDPDDQKFLELAHAARADILVTKDKALLALAHRMLRLSCLRILLPAQACARLADDVYKPSGKSIVPGHEST
jgi:putative PIN family toxin of toxin-antitoxin system